MALHLPRVPWTGAAAPLLDGVLGGDLQALGAPCASLPELVAVSTSEFSAYRAGASDSFGPRRERVCSSSGPRRSALCRDFARAPSYGWNNFVPRS